MTTPEERFRLLDTHSRYEGRQEALMSRRIPASLLDLGASAPMYQPSAELEDAVNVALAVGSPLLLTGEPGTGKTQVAWYLGWYFGEDAKATGAIPKNVYPLHVRSDTTASDLLYTFDHIAYLRESQRGADEVDKERFLSRGPLWQAFQAEGPAVVLIDEIDKAPRDFPNDLLHVLDQHAFHVRELDRHIKRPEERPPPIVVITSNSERRLPEPFLRRCIFHHIPFDEDVVRRAVDARRADYQALDEATLDLAIRRFLDLREQYELRKKPATAELLVWLAVLNAMGDVDAPKLDTPNISAMPALSALVKDRDDLDRLVGY